MVAGRGDAKFSVEVTPSNFIILYGTKPGKMVKLDTQMIKDFIDNIYRRTDRIQFKVMFPDVLYQMKTEDANFEMADSNSIQKLNLYHRQSIYKSQYHGAATKQIGIIFANFEVKTHPPMTES